MTTSGVAIGRKISRFVVLRAAEAVAHQREGDHRPEDRGHERRDQPDLDARDERGADAGTPHRSVQASSENSFQLRLNLPFGLLKDSTMITAIGMNR